MENLEITARTVEEATKKALTQLNVGLDKVEIHVLAEGKSGILGIGAEDARISVRIKAPPRDEEQEEIQVARNILENLLARLGIKAEIKVIALRQILDSEGATDSVILNIEGDDLGNLIGRRGTTIDALQYLVRLISARQSKSKTPIMVDVQSYKQRRYEDLRTLAMNVALQVKTRKSSCRLEPMSAFERRIIHLTLANDPDVTTESVGEGDSRKVVVLPKNNK
jgi:spoIIIJ-associated protein